LRFFILSLIAKIIFVDLPGKGRFGVLLFFACLFSKIIVAMTAHAGEGDLSKSERRQYIAMLNAIVDSNAQS
jgi:cell division protein FtsL